MENLIIKYLTNNINDDELKTLSDWLLIGENKSKFKKFVSINYKIDTISDNEINKKLAYFKVKKKIHKSFNYQYAAILLSFIALSIAIFFSVNKNNINFNNVVLEIASGELIEIKDKFQIVKKGKDTLCTIKNDTITYFNKSLKNEQHKLKVPNGKIFNLILNDKTLISINSGSEITYQTNFNHSKNRKTHLVGEAYFNVKRNIDKPFIISTSKIKVKVLGTKFNVTSYKNENNTSVVLDEGSVKVSPINDEFNKNGITLKPNEQFLLNKNISHLKNVFVKKHISWKEQRLYFKNDSFIDIIKKLERFYNIQIENKSSKLNSMKFSGIFSNQPISKILNTFQEISNFKYTINKDKIIIYEK